MEEDAIAGFPALFAFFASDYQRRGDLKLNPKRIVFFVRF